MVDAGQDSGGGHEFDRMFPDRRAEGESTLRQCQLVMIRMLRILDHMCRAEGISFWLTAGTLIGALRHKGMIPWDCDIDVGITEEDYAALLEVTDRLPPDIFFQTRDTDPGYPDDLVIAKLRDRYSNYHEWQAAHPEARWHNGLQVDIILYRRNDAGLLVNPFRGTAYQRSEIFPLRRLEFEGAMMPVPADPAYYISRRYGDFLKKPPPSERIAHEGRADPFTPCDHPESRPWPGPIARRRDSSGFLRPLVSRLLGR